MKFDVPYCLTHQDGKTHYASGEIRKQRLLAEVPKGGRWPVLSMVPFSQLRERGFDDFDRAYSELAHIYHGERMKRSRNSWIREAVQALIDEPLDGLVGAGEG